MSGFPLTLLLGFLAGFLGAVPPGPLNVTIIRKASHGRCREAYRVGLGGAVIDTLICGAIGLGFGWVLEKVVTVTWVKVSLALFLLGYGLKVLILDRKRDAAAFLAEEEEEKAGGDAAPKAAPASHLRSLVVGLLQGAANPTLFVNWTIFIGFLVGHRLLKTDRASAAGFAVGVGLGVFSWFSLLTTMLERLKDHPVGNWLRRSTVLAGVLLVLFGLYFTIRSVGEI